MSPSFEEIRKKTCASVRKIHLFEMYTKGQSTGIDKVSNGQSTCFVRPENLLNHDEFNKGDVDVYAIYKMKTR
jgi:hypothetical protein